MRRSRMARGCPTLEIPGWGKMQNAILSQRDTVMQFGIAGGRFAQRKELIRTYPPEMLSVAFVAHDECFDYDPTRVPKEIYGIHSRAELEEYCTLCNELGVKIEVEAFHTGGFWNAQRNDRQGPAGQSGLDHLLLRLEGRRLDASDRRRGALHAQAPAGRCELERQRDGSARALEGADGGHCRGRPCARRHGGQPVSSPGEYARTNAELVEKIMRIARELGRDIASPADARKIIGLKQGGISEGRQRSLEHA